MEKEEWLFRAQNNKPIVFSRDIAGKTTTLTFGDDVAACISCVAGNKQCLGQAYNCVSDKTIQWKDVLEIYLDAIECTAGIRPKVVWVDRYQDMKLNCYQTRYDRMFDRSFDNAKIKALMGNANFLPVWDGLTRGTLDFLKNPKYRLIPWKRMGFYDRLSHGKFMLMSVPGFKDKLRYSYAYFMR